MTASVYIRGDSIHFYNESGSFSSLGGFAYELGKPLLNFACYDPEAFIGAFSEIAEVFDGDYAHVGAAEPEFVAVLRESVGEIQRGEPYVWFYAQALVEFVYAFIESPRLAVAGLGDKMPGAGERLAWAADFAWPAAKVPYADKERRLFRAVMDAVRVMYGHLCAFQQFVANEIEVLLHYRREIEVPDGRSVDYIDILDEYHMETAGGQFYLERPFRTFYGRVASGEVEQLYEVSGVEDLFRFEFVKMVERDIFIKKCRNCGRFFMPERRVDAEYCNRIWGDTRKRCNEIGAMLRYERKVAENPVWEAYKRAYRRLNSRARAKKMSQSEFAAWSDEAARKRDECLAGALPFGEFAAWLERGRVRKARGKAAAPDSDGRIEQAECGSDVPQAASDAG